MNLLILLFYLIFMDIITTEGSLGLCFPSGKASFKCAGLKQIKAKSCSRCSHRLPLLDELKSGGKLKCPQLRLALRWEYSGPAENPEGAGCLVCMMACLHGNPPYFNDI